MAYTTQTDIEVLIPPDKLLELADDDNDGDVDAGILNPIIADVDGLIDGFCQAKYTVPFITVPAIIKSISKDLTCFRLYQRKVLVETPEAVLSLQKNAMKLLEKIASGELALGVTVPDTGVIRTNKTSDDRTFPKSVLDQY
ncbi:MAG: DUF1320 domain-containing protein [Bacteroidetes bacterium]|nr:DUF1320 domain-containing protein [Bacteroidota bacterium]